MEDKKKNTKKQSRYQKAINAIIWAVVFIIALDVFCILVITYPGFFGSSLEIKDASGVAQERTLLSTGLSLTGIAISVWATLNILNALDKKDVEELNRQVKKLTNEYKQLNSYKEKYDIEVAKVKAQSRNTFLYHVEQNACDYSMSYIAKKFVDMANIPYSQLSIVMLHYSRVYQLYNQQADDHTISSVAKEGIAYVNGLLSSNEGFNTTVIQFLHFCLAELYFYLAYCYRGKERYQYSMKAIAEYNNAQDLFGVSIPEYNANDVSTNPDKRLNFTSYDNHHLLAYWCNTYGECYSKAVQGCNYSPSIRTQKEEINILRNKAIFYCGYAVRLTRKKNQTYLRNFGCAIEAAYEKKAFEGEIANDITKLYQSAMDVCIKNGHIPYKVFYTWLSFYHKCTDHRIETLWNCRSEDEWLACIETYTESGLSIYNKMALFYSELAHKEYPDKLVFLKFHAFALRNLCIWEVKSKGKTELACEYYKKLNQVWQTLHFLCANDHDVFMDKLTNWYAILKSVFES